MHGLSVMWVLNERAAKDQLAESQAGRPIIVVNLSHLARNGYTEEGGFTQRMCTMPISGEVVLNRRKAAH